MGLDKTQKDELNKIKQNAPKEFEKLRAEKKIIREKMKEAFLRDANKEELRKLHKEKLKIKEKIAIARFEKMLSVREVLNPEQRKQFQELMQKKRKGR